MIEIENLEFSYGAVPVLKNISMRLEEGRIYGLLGENGVGKTTLLTLLCGLKPVRTGKIVTDGRNPFDREPDFLANQFFLADEVAPVSMKAAAFAKAHGAFWPRFDYDKFLVIMKEFENDPVPGGRYLRQTRDDDGKALPRSAPHLSRSPGKVRR